MYGKETRAAQLSFLGKIVYRNFMTGLLAFEPIKGFIDAVGGSVKQYFGKDDACIIYLRPDGVFYAQGLYQWLTEKKKNIVIGAMEDDGADLDENLVKGRKVLIVDNDVVTGKGYKRSMETLRVRRKELRIKDIKFAAFSDRVGLADFSVAKYSAEAIWSFAELDAIDLKILQCLAKDGREALADVGKKVNLSSVAVKNRLEKLLRQKIVSIEAAFNIEQFYTMCVQIYIETDEKTVDQLIEKFTKRQEVFMLVRVTGVYNLLVGVLGAKWQNIQDFIESEIRPIPAVRKIFISTGEAPVIPKTIPFRPS